MNLKDVFDNFILSRKLSGLSNKTIINYKEFIEPFVSFLGYDREYETINQTDINNYILKVMDKDITRATLSTYIRHLKIFLRWADCEYKGNYNVKNIKVPRMPKKNVYIYTDEEIKDIFKSVDISVEWIKNRNKAIIALMLDSGLRQNEICTLKQSKININEKYITVLGKGNKERTVPLGNITKEYVKKYIKECPYKSDYLFVRRDGNNITCNTIKLMIAKLAKKLPFELSSHKLRHNFATNYCLNQYEQYGNIDINKLMYLMGHEDSRTTQRYLHLAYEFISVKNCISHVDNIYRNKIP